MVVEALQNENFFFNQPLKLVGAVDIAQESCLWAASRGIEAHQSLASLLSKTKPQVIIHTTASSLAQATPQLLEILSASIPVVSSTEELFYPWVRNAGFAQNIQEACIKAGVAVLGTGANPGFIMDVLPATLMQVCQTVDQIKVSRIVNASMRRAPLQRRIGVGMTVEQFKEAVAAGRVAPAGLLESMDFLKSFLGWSNATVEQTIEPILTNRALQTSVFNVKKDHVIGYRQRAVAEWQRRRVIDLDLKVYLEAERPGDHIVIQGTPPLNLWIEGGVPGDPSAVAALIRGIPIVLNAKPGIVRRLERGTFLT
jgi:4-hydroxy-tetrahydrodipicolinate reductase